jgi:hypothetical protein
LPEIELAANKAASAMFHEGSWAMSWQIRAAQSFKINVTFKLTRNAVILPSATSTF